ncbi:MAG: DUF4367 domain-containing protein [Clostridia bacterium]|nr:DUF4367 domain-containing protein [Clostridia bacterium]
MTSIEKELANAYGEVIDAEIEAAMAEAAKQPHTFSKEFEQRMNELLSGASSAEKEARRVSKRRIRRIILIAIAAVLALALAACAIPEVREFVAGFFVQHKGDHDEYTEPEVTKERIEEEYGIVPIPDGFDEVVSVRTEKTIIVDYNDQNGNSISLEQSASDRINDSIDSENGEFSELDINGKRVRLYIDSDGYAQASWVENGYYFSLCSMSPVDKETFEEWIASVQAK